MKYKLKMVVANISHKSWWWNGKSVYEFETLKELEDFMIEHIPLDKCEALNYMTRRESEIDFIRKNDKKKSNGKLASTSWYEVEKGEHQMTEYTSF